MAKTILIVEDNALNMKLLNDLLQAEKYATLCARSAEEGLELARKKRPDLVLMDLRLPGMSGLDAVREMRADPDLRPIPVAAVTAFAMNGDMADIKDAGCDAFIEKPFSIETLLGTILGLLM
ncbi:MAG: response regulator [Rhodospirillales bacterium]|nr:response regulator [Rhodospirillales bacterium]